MEYISFGGTNTWNDWKMYLTNMSIDKKEVRLVKKDSPSIDGEIDDTDKLSGSPDYGLGKIIVELYSKQSNTSEHWLATYNKVINAIHGKKMNVNINGSSQINGRVTVTNFHAEGRDCVFTVEVEG